MKHQQSIRQNHCLFSAGQSIPSHCFLFSVFCIFPCFFVHLASKMHFFHTSLSMGLRVGDLTYSLKDRKGTQLIIMKTMLFVMSFSKLLLQVSYNTNVHNITCWFVKKLHRWQTHIPVKRAYDTDGFFKSFLQPVFLPSAI